MVFMDNAFLLQGKMEYKITETNFHDIIWIIIHVLLKKIYDTIGFLDITLTIF